jgi:N-hydroxyarylamine O-acetyltransferase
VIDPERYLQRIGIDAQVGPPTVELLAALQVAHMTHVPFENLHVYHRRGPRTDTDWSVHKIVDERRGGWCFEVNGAFAGLLQALGFRAHHVSCQVWESTPGEWGPPFDHLATMVELEGERWFVDVGFGDNCLEPLTATSVDRVSVPRPVRTSLTTEADGVDHLMLTELMPLDDHEIDGEAAWEPQLRVRLQPTTLDLFEPRATHLQTHPGLSWQEKAFATRAVDASGGRITLRSAVLRRREGAGAYVDTTVDPSEWSALLLSHFGLVDTLDRQVPERNR